MSVPPRKSGMTLCVLKIELTRRISGLRTGAFWLNQSCRLFR